jgi:hypothetical protein
MSGMMMVVIFSIFSFAASLAQYIACWAISGFIGCARLIPSHLCWIDGPLEPNIWSIWLRGLYDVIDERHVIGDEKWECFIEKLSIKKSRIGVFMWYWFCDIFFIECLWYNAITSISKF